MASEGDLSEKREQEKHQSKMCLWEKGKGNYQRSFYCFLAKTVAHGSAGWGTSLCQPMSTPSTQVSELGVLCAHNCAFVFSGLFAMSQYLVLYIKTTVSSVKVLAFNVSGVVGLIFWLQVSWRRES